MFGGLSAQLLPPALCATMAAASLAVSVAATVRADAGVVAAVFPPWWSSKAAFDAAASTGDVLQRGAGPAILVVRSDQAGLPARLRAAGALIVLDPQGALGCADRKDRTHV